MVLIGGWVVFIGRWEFEGGGGGGEQMLVDYGIFDGITLLILLLNVVSKG
jgi:hypothetical protein